MAILVLQRELMERNVFQSYLSSIRRRSTSQPLLQERQAISFRNDTHIRENINQNDGQALDPLLKQSNENKTQSDKKQVAVTRPKKKIIEDKTESKSICHGKQSTGAVPKQLNKNKEEPHLNQGERQRLQKNTYENNKDSDLLQNSNLISCGISMESDEERNMEILERIIKHLENDKSKKFLSMLEAALAVASNSGSKISFDLIQDLLYNIHDCKTERELLALKEKLTGRLVPGELRPFTLHASSIHTVCFLNQGTFGTAIKAELKTAENKKIDVVMKVPRDGVFTPLFIGEALVLSKQNHKNVISMLGFLNTTQVAIVMEYMDLGNLVDACKTVNFTNLNLFNILVEVATGMEYIAQQKYVHRDLACCNVLINSKYEVKIGDFGLCRYVGDTTDGVYKEEMGLKLDDYTMAPEYITTDLYTTECDVWSMGVLCWELFHRATLKDSKFLKSLRFQKPARCPLNLYSFIMECCMNLVSNNRPSFTAIKTKLLQMIQNKDYE